MDDNQPQSSSSQSSLMRGEFQCRLDALLAEFASATNWESRYRKIIDWGKKLPVLPESERTEEIRVRGCQSQVWLKASFADGKIRIEADSDALIVRGLVAVLVRLFSGLTPETIIDQPLDFFTKLGFEKNLSPSRTNGFFAMTKQIKIYALALRAQNPK